jgi:brefeldin A-inhibited guanine nucleotide-exchange protein
VLCLYAGVMDAVEEELLSRVIEVSDTLDAEAIIEFFHALTTVSLEELSGRPTPRVFALSKIVESCHHNMMRPRIVWTILWKGSQDAADPQPHSGVWQGLSSYFVDIGCHGNLQVAMYAMDALRQVPCSILHTLLLFGAAQQLKYA